MSKLKKVAPAENAAKQAQAALDTKSRRHWAAGQQGLTQAQAWQELKPRLKLLRMLRIRPKSVDSKLVSGNEGKG